MAHLALTLDPDPNRREQFARRARQQLSSWPELDVQSREIGQLQVVWGCGARTPWSDFCDGEQFSLLIGYAVDDDGKWLSSCDLANQIASSSKPSVLGDGYYAAKVLVEFPLQCQKPNHHMQTRMARKLQDGTYLVPHLLDFAVKQYDNKGNILNAIDTSVPGDVERATHTWPFTAIRHGDGHTLVCCTNGNRVIDFDAAGKIVWELTNKDLPGPWLQDPCGGQVLPNGNVVITSYAAGGKDPKGPKLIEVNREKVVVWTYVDGQPVGIHHFQILKTNGEVLRGPTLK